MDGNALGARRGPGRTITAIAVNPFNACIVLVRAYPRERHFVRTIVVCSSRTRLAATVFSVLFQ
jgi:hypothetical protein